MIVSCARNPHFKFIDPPKLFYNLHPLLDLYDLPERFDWEPSINVKLYWKLNRKWHQELSKSQNENAKFSIH